MNHQEGKIAVSCQHQVRRPDALPLHHRAGFIIYLHIFLYTFIHISFLYLQISSYIFKYFPISSNISCIFKYLHTSSYLTSSFLLSLSFSSLCLSLSLSFSLSLSLSFSSLSLSFSSLFLSLFFFSTLHQKKLFSKLSKRFVFQRSIYMGPNPHAINCGNKKKFREVLERFMSTQTLRDRT